jgi:hypothetical protein
MNFDLVLAGVGGQGVLSIAWVLDHAAHAAGWHLKQSEVHGMAQRGGAVSAFVRMSDRPVAALDKISFACSFPDCFRTNPTRSRCTPASRRSAMQLVTQVNPTRPIWLGPIEEPLAAWTVLVCG